MFYPNYLKVLSFALPIFLLAACNNNGQGKEKDIVANPNEMNKTVQENIQGLVTSAQANNGKITDSLPVQFLPVVAFYYKQNNGEPVWSNKEKWLPNADSLVQYLNMAAYQGLYKEDYDFNDLSNLKNILDADSAKRTDAVLWAKADVLFTGAFMHLVQDLKQGRMQPDSLTLEKNESCYQKYFADNLDRIKNGQSFSSTLTALQPSISGYTLLKQGIKNFVGSMDTKEYTYLGYPYQDSVGFIKKLQKRLGESGIKASTPFDTTQLRAAIKKYQAERGIRIDGKVSAALVKFLNNTDREKFNRIAITLDRYKELPAQMPKKYILVNLPAYNLKVWDDDTIALESKVICGKPSTPTPFITSAISDIIIYPTWTIPASIIKKEILPALKRNTGYLAKKGFSLVSYKGEVIDPSTVNWSKYKNGIPYKVVQGSGIDNALGVIKFNFNNPYSVYLHDTNQRYLFNNSVRSLSHACVRVQDWQKLAFYLVRNDSMLARHPDSLHYNTDSIRNWVASKEHRRIDMKNRVSLFIRYFGCELVKGYIKFYDDVYGEDKAMREKYFSQKKFSL